MTRSHLGSQHKPEDSYELQSVSKVSDKSSHISKLWALCRRLQKT